MMAYEQKAQDLKNDILRFQKACKSAWPQPSDYTNLIDAQYALRELQQAKENTPETPKPLTWFTQNVNWKANQRQNTRHA